MEKFKGKTKYLWIVIIFFTSLLFVGVSFFVAKNTFKTSKTHATIGSETYLYFNGQSYKVGSSEHENIATFYINNSVFEIYNESDYQNLVAYSHAYTLTGNASGYVGERSYIFDFNNKKITLNYDITFSTDEWPGAFYRNFLGTFDGQGYTVRHESIFAPLYYTDDKSSGNSSRPGTCYRGVFFDALMGGGVIRNTKFENISAYIPNQSGQPSNEYLSHIGGVVGFNRGTIENCIVMNTIFEQQCQTPNPVYTGPIAGQNEGIIQDCIVDGVHDCHNGNKKNITIDGVKQQVPFVRNAFVGGQPVDIHVVNSIYYCNPNGAYLDRQGGYVYNLQEDWDNPNSPYHGQGGDYYGGINEEGITVPGEDGPAWFKFKNRNYGLTDSNGKLYCMYLRMFMDFTIFNFIADPREAGYFTNRNNNEITSYIVPSNYAGVEEKGNSLVFEYCLEESVENEIITVNESENYSFSKWSKTEGGVTTYKAHFAQDTLKISFINKDSNCDVKVIVGTKEKMIALNKISEHRINNGGSVNITTIKYQKSGSYKQVIFSFSDAGNSGALTKIIFTPKRDYYIKSTTIGLASVIIKEDKSNISCEVKAKGYNIIID